MLGDLSAQDAMIAATALRDVMQQNRDIENPPRQQLAHDLGGQRVIHFQVALFHAS